jgi:hypothetical protein
MIMTIFVKNRLFKKSIKNGDKNQTFAKIKKHPHDNFYTL